MDNPPSQQPPNEPYQDGLWTMRLFSLAGMVLLALGTIGLWVPVLPTTIFLIGAAACFARSSPRLHAYLMNHPRYSLVLRDWFDEGAISKRGKAAALWGMGFGMAFLIIFAGNPVWIAIGSLVLIASAWFVLSRPNPSRSRPASKRGADQFRREFSDD